MNNTARNCLQATIIKIEGAYAPATIRAYKSNFENFIKYCEENNQEALPASSEVVVTFIKSISDGRLKSASIRMAVASIATIHKLNRFNDPVNDPDVKLEMRRMHRHLGRASSQAYGINKDLLDKMITSTDNSLRGIRDKAILLVAYDSLCRRSELVSLEIEDLVIDSNNENLRLKLRRSKTDPDGIGKNLYLSNEAQLALKEWIIKSKIFSGKILRSITATGRIKENINPSQINRIYKRIAEKTNIEASIVKNISGHSLRVGAAQDLLSSGASLPEIMNRGRWSKIDTVMRYIENANSNN
jgi:site-specific recombinase XerD